LHDCLANSRKEDRRNNNNTPLKTRGISSEYDDLADLRIKVGDRVFRCHQMILALRSEYFRTRLSRRTDFRQHHYDVLEEHDVSAQAFEKMLEYIYTDELQDLGDDPLTQAEELLDVASRYLLFQLKPVVAKLLLPHLVLYRVSPAQLCRWLTLSDMYDVVEVREHCLHIMACNFETFAEAREFRALLLASRTPADNLVNNLQRRWVRITAAGLSET
jgi:ankyrin repeat/BTB/POZ domain-containing protein 1